MAPSLRIAAGRPRGGHLVAGCHGGEIEAEEVGCPRLWVSESSRIELLTSRILGFPVFKGLCQPGTKTLASLRLGAYGDEVSDATDGWQQW